MIIVLSSKSHMAVVQIAEFDWLRVNFRKMFQKSSVGVLLGQYSGEHLYDHWSSGFYFG